MAISAAFFGIIWTFFIFGRHTILTSAVSYVVLLLSLGQALTASFFFSPDVPWPCYCSGKCTLWLIQLCTAHVFWTKNANVCGKEVGGGEQRRKVDHEVRSGNLSEHCRWKQDAGNNLSRESMNAGTMCFTISNAIYVSGYCALHSALKAFRDFPRSVPKGQWYTGCSVCV